MVIENLTNVNPIVFHSIIALASVIVLAKSADMMVYSISDYAKKLGISDYLIGFLVISIGTALPELVASINASLLNAGQVVFGTIIGSNIFKIPLLGLVLLIARKIKTQFGDMGNAPIITIIIIILPLMLIMDNYLSRFDGVILIVVFIVYVINLWKSEGKLGKIKKKVELRNIAKDVIIFILALIALLLSARWLVFSSLELSKTLNISSFLIGAIIIGIGASAPELTVQIRSVIRNQHNMAFGNVLGSIVANSALVLGIVGIISPFHVMLSAFKGAAIIMVLGLIVSIVIIQKEIITWKHGLLLIGIYILFLLMEIIF